MIKNAGAVRRMTVVLTAGALYACGTQIGNPTGNGARVTSEPGNLGTLTNAAFLTTVDGMNMGDYAYSSSESRLVSKRTCDESAPKGASLVQSAESTHWVEDETSLVFARSNVSLARSYSDQWLHNGKAMACEGGGEMNLDLSVIDEGPVLLNSQVSEGLQRKLYATLKENSQQFTHSLVTQREGERTLKLLSYQRLPGGLIELTASLVQANLLETIETNKEDGRKQTIKLRAGDRPLEFRITLNARTNQWVSYSIDSASLDFYVNELESFAIEFNKIRFDRSKGCVPQAGTLRVKAPSESEASGTLTYVGQFDDGNGNLVMKPLNSLANPLILAPFACVLKER
jgi:hypothetical protein